MTEAQHVAAKHSPGPKSYYGALLAALSSALMGSSLSAEASTNVPYDGAGVAYNINGAVIFTLIPPLSSSGTGTFGGFLKVNDNDPVLQGISTGSSNTWNPPNSVDDSGTDALPVGNLAGALVNINGGAYYSFALDLNEPNNGDRYVSVDDVRIYHASDPNPTALNLNDFLNNNPTSPPSLVWDMDVGINGDVSLLVDEGLTSGSGRANLAFAVPASLFQSLTGYLFIYYREGVVGTSLNDGRDYGNAGGFEEFGLISGLGNIDLTDVPNVGPNPPDPGQPEVPEAGTGAAAVMVGLAGLAAARRFRR